MRRGWWVLASVVSLCAASCSSVETTPPGGGGTGNAGGGGLVAGSSGSADGGVSVAGNCYQSPHITCFESCFVAHPRFVVEVCQNDTWVCPSNAVAFGSCPPGSCARQDRLCCNPSTGEANPPSCGADGFFDPCLAGTAESSIPVCVPDYLHAPTCDGLDGQFCPMQGHQCLFGIVSCSCDAGDGGLTWSCHAPPI